MHVCKGTSRSGSGQQSDERIAPASAGAGTGIPSAAVILAVTVDGNAAVAASGITSASAAALMRAAAG